MSDIVIFTVAVQHLISNSDTDMQNYDIYFYCDALCYRALIIGRKNDMDRQQLCF